MGRVSNARERLIEVTIDLIWRHGYSGTTVDAICDRASLNKGSFYHFFESKDDLVVAALESHWQDRKRELDRLFSPAVPPLQRLQSYFQHVYQRQLELKAARGHFPGCLYSSIGSECAQQNPTISKKVQEILSTYLRYYESALREAQAEGLIQVKDLAAKAKSLFAYMEGVLSQARIQDDPELIRNLAKNAIELLGIQDHRKKAS